MKEKTKHICVTGCLQVQNTGDREGILSGLGNQGKVERIMNKIGKIMKLEKTLALSIQTASQSGSGFKALDYIVNSGQGNNL